MKRKNKILLIISALIIFTGMFVFAQKLQKSYNNTIAEKSTITDERENKEDSKNDKINKEVSNKETSTDTTDNKENSKINKSNEEVNDKENIVDNDSSIVKDNYDANNKKTSNTKNSSAEKKETSSEKKEPSNLTDSSKVTVEPKKEEQAPDVKDETPNFIVIDTISNKTLASKHVNYDNITVAQLTFKVLDELGIKYRTTGFNDTTYFASIAGLREKAAGPLSGWCFYVKKSGSNEFVKPNVGTGSWIYNKGDTVIWKYWEDGVNN
ncbi:hypothetical protein GCM10008908_13140 [Clostridium subterminale]|uniref:DUF4430 domain-containing protein n=1 Tax=Clostridium subterminale TaxID=1550 RepID=A0ABP3VV36_CLOSU